MRIDSANSPLFVRYGPSPHPSYPFFTILISYTNNPDTLHFSDPYHASFLHRRNVFLVGSVERVICSIHGVFPSSFARDLQQAMADPYGRTLLCLGTLYLNLEQVPVQVTLIFGGRV